MQDIIEQGLVGELTLDVIFFRLLLAVIFGGIVGLERERRHRPAGFRTHILVCFGAAIVSMVQDQLRIEILSYSGEYQNFADFIKTDLGRLGAQVISGIGFLGAGCIIKDRGDMVVGMTTAAGIWATGCVGLGIGWGFYNIAIVAIVFMLIIMVGLKYVEDKMARKSKEISLKIEMNKDEVLTNFVEQFQQKFDEKNWSVIGVDKDLENNVLSYQVVVEREKEISEMMLMFSKLKGVKSIREEK